MLFPPPQGFPKLFTNNWFPSCISAKTAGNRRDGTKRLSWTWLGLIKKACATGGFCSFQCFKIWSDCLNFKHWPVLSSASGALLIFTVKSTLNYTRVLRQSTTTKKKKQSIIPRSDAVVCDIWSGRTRFGNSFIESGTDNPCWSKQKRRGRKWVRSSGAFFYHSQ